MEPCKHVTVIAQYNANTEICQSTSMYSSVQCAQGIICTCTHNVVSNHATLLATSPKRFIHLALVFAPLQNRKSFAHSDTRYSVSQSTDSLVMRVWLTTPCWAESTQRLVSSRPALFSLLEDFYYYTHVLSRGDVTTVMKCRWRIENTLN